MADPVAWYDTNASAVAALYEQVAADAVHSWLAGLLPKPQATVLDVGAGSGRDAIWLAAQGHDVVAVEPSAAMRTEAARHHPGAGVRWISDALPELATVTRSGVSFDVILLSAVWMHVAPSERKRAFRKLINLLKPGGLLAITLRHGPAEPERGINSVSLQEVEALAREYGAFVETSREAEDALGRDHIRWMHLAIRLPDDGTGALPLLRHVILNDDKRSTYKLALLRVLCRVADGAAGFARDHGEDCVAVPVGLVAVTWIRLYKPLLKAGLPQSPSNIGEEKLGFVKGAYRELAEVSHLDLRVGMAFSGEIGAALHQALKDAADTIARMPATYMTYPNGGAILSVSRTPRVPRPSRLLLDRAYLSSFGDMLIPRHIWTALQRFDAWIEPALVSEWGRLIKVYANGQGRSVDEVALAAAMTWDEPSRDVRLARQRALKLVETGDLVCVWSGKRLNAKTLDLDHCFPWSAWPCGDLWNLMPTHRAVNQREKRARLTSDRLLRAAQGRIVEWWERAFTSENPVVRERFWLEAAASLPSMNGRSTSLSELCEAMSLQRIRLRYDQQVPEWNGEKYVVEKPSDSSALSSDWCTELSLDSADPFKPGLYEWRIEGLGVYIGQYTRRSRHRREYRLNVLRLLNGHPYRKKDPYGFRSVHHALATAVREGRRITLTIIENQADKSERNRREQELIRIRRREAECGGLPVLNSD